MNTPQTTQTIPAGFLASLQLERVSLERQHAEITGRLSQISAIENMCANFAEGNSWQAAGGLQVDTATKATRRRGRPSRINTDQQPYTVRIAKNSGERLSSEVVALEALNTLPSGGTSAQIVARVNELYGSGSYLPNILTAALNRAWRSRKIASNEPIVAGTQFQGEYYSLNRLPKDAVMAPEKTQESQRAAATG